MPILLHAIASAILRGRVTPRLISSIQGYVPFLSGSWPYFIAAAGLHSAYNIGATVLELVGVLEF